MIQNVQNKNVTMKTIVRNNNIRLHVLIYFSCVLFMGVATTTYNVRVVSENQKTFKRKSL